MAESLKILGQAVGGTSAAALYAVPSSTQAVVSSVIIANTISASATFRLFATRPGSTTYDATTALFYDVTVAANSTVTLQLGIALAATSVLAIRASAAGTLTFTAFGQEIS